MDIKKAQEINRRDFLGLMAAGTTGILLSGCNTVPGKISRKEHFDPRRLTPVPPLGWNSWDCLGYVANERRLLENIDVFAKKLRPHGYKYFVVDAGWFNEYTIKPEEEFPSDDSSRYVQIDQYGRSLPSKISFPNGLKPVIDHAHKLGVKFGVWLIRGVNRTAVEKNLPIKGTKYHASDIANTNDICSWCDYNYGVDMDKPGAQEYYNSILELLAEWGVDFVKYDDIVPFPKEIEAVANAIENCGRDIVLSLSPGGDINEAHISSYRRADMVRITSDVWDRRKDLVKGFDRWEQMAKYGGQGFWLDLDMIPFGNLTVWNRPDKPGMDGRNLEDGRGFARMDNFTVDQKQAFMTQRALAASPLFMGGNLPGTDDLSFSLITNSEMLACNKNGVVGKLVHRQENLDVWQSPHKSKPDYGWLGIFNRSESPCSFRLTKRELSLNENSPYEFYDIWNSKIIRDHNNFDFSLGGDGVAFLRYQKT